MPVRKVSNRGGNIIGRFPSLRLARVVDYESSIERDYLYLLDFERAVSWFAEQPLTIDYEDQGKGRRYTPDFHVINNGQHILVECKPQTHVDREKNQRKFAVARQWCKEQGWAFEVVTDEQLRSGYRLTNIKRLTQFARYPIPADVKHCLRTYVTTALPTVTIANILHQVTWPTYPSMLIPLYHMIFHHELCVPLDDGRLSNDMTVTLPQENIDERTPV